MHPPSVPPSTPSARAGARAPAGATAVSGPPPVGPPPSGGGRPTARRRAVPWAVLALWVVLLVAAAPFAGKLGDSQEDDPVGYLPASAESTAVAELERELPGGSATGLIVVYQRDGGLTAADRRHADARLADIAAAYPSGRDTGDTGETGETGEGADAGDAAGGDGGGPGAVPSSDGETVMYPLAVTGLTTEEAEAAAVADIRQRLAAGLPAGLTVQLGGPGALSTDMEAAFEGIDETLMLVTVSVVTVLLILIYRSPLLWLLPLICVGVAAFAAMALVYGLVQAFGTTVTTMSSSIMMVLVFGAGTDYALLLIARYREELRRHRYAHDAMLAAVRGCGPAVLASSGTVAAGLLCLLAADLNSSSGLGPVGAVGVLCALATMLTLLPALLVLTGRRVFWPLAPRHGAAHRPRYGVFARLGGSVARRPVTVLVTSLALLGGLMLGLSGLPGQLKDEDNFIDTPESVTAMETLAEAYPERSSRPITVLAHSDRAAEVLTVIEGTEGVATARPERAGAGWTEIAVHAVDPPESDGEKRTVTALRAALGDLAPAETGEAGDGAAGEAGNGAGDGRVALVGGETAKQLDLAATSAADIRLVVPLVLAVVLLILIVLLRAVLAPVILLAAVVLSWGSALGLAGLLFSPVFGFAGTDPQLPLLSFVFGVALGVDYGIFLMHRMREEVLNGTGTREAALAALRTTGGVIASAGVVLAATFAVLTTLPLVMMVQIGFVIAVGVLLDTFLVRTYVVTSAGWLLADRVWWPGPLSRPRAARASGRPSPLPTGKGPGTTG